MSCGAWRNEVERLLDTLAYHRTFCLLPAGECRLRECAS